MIHSERRSVGGVVCQDVLGWAQVDSHFGVFCLFAADFCLYNKKC